jgi:hypothetical protein
LIALAVLSGFAVSSHADASLSVWGNIDVGLMAAHSKDQTRYAFQDGQLLPSEFGIKGSQDVDGLKVGFALTAGFDSANGAQDVSNAVGSLFGREAKLTLGGSWGTIGFGLQFDPALVSSISTEPRGLADTFSNLGPAVVAAYFNGKPGSLTGGAFDANSVSYTYHAKDLYFGVLREIGGQQAGNQMSGSSIGTHYSVGGLTGSIGYSDFRDANGAVSMRYTVGGLAYSAGAFAVRAQLGTYYSEGSEFFATDVPGPAHIHSAGIGTDWKSSEHNKLNVAWYHMQDKDSSGGTRTLALLDTYKLSNNQTTLFAQVAFINADANAGATNVELYSPANTGAAGGHTTAIGVGVNHTF